MTATATPRRTKLRLDDPADRLRLDGALELATIQREDQADLRRIAERLLAPLAVDPPDVLVRRLGPDLGTFSLGDGVEDVPTITIAARVLAGSFAWARPRRDPVGYRRFVTDLVVHETAHHLARVRSVRGDGPPLGQAKHGAAFREACVLLRRANSRYRTGSRPSWLPLLHPARASAWPVSMRQLRYYGGSVDRSFLLSVKRRREDLG